jgi:hypothetical protein
MAEGMVRTARVLSRLLKMLQGWCPSDISYRGYKQVAELPRGGSDETSSADVDNAGQRSAAMSITTIAFVTRLSGVGRPLPNSFADNPK